MTLSQKTIDICKATAPTIEMYGEQITTRMYELLFSNYPEVKPLFEGAPENQHSKLANTIAVYAANIDHVEMLEKAVEIMAQKHVETQVKPEHYPMVGASLLQALKDVLGDNASDEIIQAWEEAYFFLANILMRREKEIYAS